MNENQQINVPSNVKLPVIEASKSFELTDETKNVILQAVNTHKEIAQNIRRQLSPAIEFVRKNQDAIVEHSRRIATLINQFDWAQTYHNAVFGLAVRQLEELGFDKDVWEKLEPRYNVAFLGFTAPKELETQLKSKYEETGLFTAWDAACLAHAEYLNATIEDKDQRTSICMFIGRAVFMVDGLDDEIKAHVNRINKENSAKGGRSKKGKIGTAKRLVYWCCDQILEKDKNLSKQAVINFLKKLANEKLFEFPDELQNVTSLHWVSDAKTIEFLDASTGAAKQLKEATIGNYVSDFNISKVSMDR